MELIKVKVVEFSDRKHFQMQWRDPFTGRKRTKSTGVERTGRKRERKEAESVAAKFEADLQNDRHSEPSKTTWPTFVSGTNLRRCPALRRKPIPKCRQFSTLSKRFLIPAGCVKLMPIGLATIKQNCESEDWPRLPSSHTWLISWLR